MVEEAEKSRRKTIQEFDITRYQSLLFTQEFKDLQDEIAAEQGIENNGDGLNLIYDPDFVNGWGGKVPSCIDPMIESLSVNLKNDGSVTIIANLEHVSRILGVGDKAGARIDEITELSGAFIDVEELEEGKLVRKIVVSKGDGASASCVENAVCKYYFLIFIFAL